MAHPDVAAAGLVVGVERAQQRRLAATRRAVERHALPGRHLEAATREDRQAGDALDVPHEGLGQILDADRPAALVTFLAGIAHVTPYLAPNRCGEGTSVSGLVTPGGRQIN